MAQFVVPISDLANPGSWATTPLWSKVDETFASADGTVITTGSGNGLTVAFDGSTVTDPSSSAGHIIRVYWAKNSAGGANAQMVVELRQGYVSEVSQGTLIATLTDTATDTTLKQSTYTLSGAEADAITDYSDLQLRCTGSKSGGGGNPDYKIDSLELELPDAGISITPTPISATFSAIAPAVVLGALALTPTPISATFSAVAPTISQTSQIDITPTPVVGTFTAVAPTVSLSDFPALAPTPIVATFTPVAPTVVNNATTWTFELYKGAGLVATWADVVIPGATVFDSTHVLTAGERAAAGDLTNLSIKSIPNGTEQVNQIDVVLNAPPGSGAISITPTPVSATFSAVAPTVSLSDYPALTPTPVSATFTAVAPTVSLSDFPALAPTPITATFTPVAPVVSIVGGGQIDITPTPVSATFTPVAPTVSLSDFPALTPTPITATFSVVPPTVTIGAILVTPTPVGATFTVVAPTVTLGTLTLTPTPVVGTFTAVGGTLTSGGILIQPTPITATFSAVAPTITLGTLTLTPTPVTATFSAVAPVLSTVQYLTPTPVSATFTAVAPTVTLGTLTLTPTPVVGTFTAIGGTLTSGGILIQPTPITATFSAVAPTVTLGTLTLTPSPVTGTWSVAAPTLSFSAILLTPSPLVATFGLAVPTVGAPGTLEYLVALRWRNRYVVTGTVDDRYAITTHHFARYRVKGTD